MPELAEVFARYGPAYLNRYGPAMLPSHRRAMQDILHCRTEAMGGQVFCCQHCGRTHYVYHSCRNRSCPKCHHQQTQAWLAQRRRELLPVSYFHLVFTVPRELHACLRSRQSELYGVLMQAAAQATLKLAADPHYVGGLAGMLCVLHTWGRTLSYHPHIHCLVTGGGLDVYVQVYEAGVTPGAGQGAGIACYVHWGQYGDPWDDIQMTYNGDIGDNDEYRATIPQAAIAAPGSGTSSGSFAQRMRATRRA